MIKNYIRIIAGLSILIVALNACGGKGNTTTSLDNIGPLSITGESEVALNGSEKITITQLNRINVTAPIKLIITNSDNSVASILQDTCSKDGISVNLGNCTFFVRGDKIGKVTITAKTIDGLKVVDKTINIARQWGSMGEAFPSGISELSITGDKVYVLSGGYVYMSENRAPWQLIGGGEAFDKNYFIGGDLISDASHVCITTRYNGGRTEKNISVKCSKNGGDWYEVGNFNADVGSKVLIDAASIYNGNIYAMIFSGGEAVVFCSIDNCTNWQQFGKSTSIPIPRGIYNKTAIVQDGTELHYLDDDGKWKLHGKNSPGNFKDIGEMNVFGLFILPNHDTVNYPYQQQIYYNDNNNIGGNFKAIGGNILIENPTSLSIHAFAVANNNVFVALGDGRIFSSTIKDNDWEKWKQVGDNNVNLAQIYANDKNLYSIHNEVDKGYVYVYSLK